MLLVYRHLVKVKNHCFDYFNEMKSSFIYNLQWSLHGIPIFLTWTPCWVYEFGANVNHTWAKVWIQTRNNEHCVKTNQKLNLWIKVSYQLNSIKFMYVEKLWESYIHKFLHLGHNLIPKIEICASKNVPKHNENHTNKNLCLRIHSKLVRK